MTVDYHLVTELSGDDVTREQVARLRDRYHWASTYCDGKDVLEVACGSGSGLGCLAARARSVHAGDCVEALLVTVRSHYRDDIWLVRFDAQAMPYGGQTFDVIVLFEAIYYIPSIEAFIGECKRVLRPGGKVLIATANKNLFDFNASPFSVAYYGVVELFELFGAKGFEAEFFGNMAVEHASWRQRILRPLKWLAVRLDLMPKTNQGKKWLKSLVFGSLVKMPAEIKVGDYTGAPPLPLPTFREDMRHKVIYCVASLPIDS